MATSKRERQKAARREKVERQMRAHRRRRNVRRGVIVAIVAIVVVGTGFFLFKGSSTPPTTTTTTTSAPPTTTTTTGATTTTAVPQSFAHVADPSPAGTFGTAPTVVVPPGKPPAAMQVSDLITGTGAVAKVGDKVTVQYVLASYSSRKVVQSSWTSSPTAGVPLTLATGSVIQGWVEGIPGMRVGGRRELIIPPSLAYKDVAAGPGIAKNDTLVFVVDLLKVG
jgi:peptidylprolyl isomerase